MTDTQHTTEPLIQQVLRIQGALKSAGIEPVDMRRAGTLDVDSGLRAMTEQELAETFKPQHLEGPFGTREITRVNESRFRWFLDGSQKTMPIWRIGVVPVVVSISVAGILERDGNGQSHLMPNSLRESLSWIVPQQMGDPKVRNFVRVLEDLGEDVRDPLASEPNYQQLSGLYDQVLYYANETAGNRRAEVEALTLDYWDTHIGAGQSDQWLLIDGRLTLDAPNAVGLIKSPSGQHLVGEEASTLLGLEAGYRTTAYRLSESDRARVHWYQRMWPETGLDARHALIRIEMQADTADHEEIDQIASWLYAERIPSAKADSRWPTLLYPVHLLERILKRRIAQITAGWPV